MKVLVTGGCGFLGSHVCEHYARKGAEVVAFDNMTKHEMSRMPYLADEARYHNSNFLASIGVEIIRGDIRNIQELSKAALNCDYIVHTAAQPAMTISVEDPVLDFTTNVSGTFNVLEVARSMRIPAASCATIHVYGNRINDSLGETGTRYTRTPAGIDESEPVATGKLTPLHASKRAADLYVQTYIHTYGLELASFRLTGIYGPRQFGGEDHGWVAHFTIRTLMEKPITIFGTGKQTRDILFASDVAAAFDAFYEKRKAGIYNIGGGPDFAISLRESLTMLESITGKKPIVQYDEGRSGDMLYFVCDCAKAEKQLGWKARVSPEEGIARLADWVRRNENLFKKE